GLTDEVRTAWAAAGSAQGYSGWQLFVQDTAYRIKFGIEGLATPSTLHGYKVGQIIMGSPADFFRLEQVHPVQYFQMVKVPGTKSQRVPKAVIEQLTLPLTVGLSYRSNLTANGANPYCKFYATVIRSYQSLDLEEEVGFNIPLSSSWDRQTATLTDVVGTA